MDSTDFKKTNSGLDVIGLGKMAEAIPKEVYTETTKGLIDTFNKIVAPITETTSGLGRYIKQKFDNMVEMEKAMAALTIQRSIEKAQMHGSISAPKHVKSFINSFEEASKEIDPVLHEMWINILTSQLIDSNFHPRYVQILASLSVNEAELLMKLNTADSIGDKFSVYMGSPRDGFKHFVLKNPTDSLLEWSYSCNILLEFELAEVMAPHEKIYNEEDRVTILYLTGSGKRFLDVVTMH